MGKKLSAICKNVDYETYHTFLLLLFLFWNKTISKWNVTNVRHQYLESVRFSKKVRHFCTLDAEGLLGGHSVYFAPTADTKKIRLSSFNFDSVHLTSGTTNVPDHQSWFRTQISLVLFRNMKIHFQTSAEAAHLIWEETDVHFLFIASRTKWLHPTDNDNYRKTINIPTLSILSLFTVLKRHAAGRKHSHLQLK